MKEVWGVHDKRVGQVSKRADPPRQTSGPSSTNEWTFLNKRVAPPQQTSGPSPNPLPAGRGVITELPLPSCCSLFVVLFAVVSHVFLHSLSPYFICLNTSVQYVHSVYLCLSVILSINIKNTTKHVLSDIICLSVIMSTSIKFPFSMYVLSVSVTCMKSGGCRQR